MNYFSIIPLPSKKDNQVKVVLKKADKHIKINTLTLLQKLCICVALSLALVTHQLEIL